MSAVITHLTKDSLSLPITGQLLTVGWFMDQKHKDKLDVPQQWVADMTSLEDNKDAALISAQTIQAMMAPGKCRNRNSLFPSPLEQLTTAI